MSAAERHQIEAGNLERRLLLSPGLVESRAADDGAKRIVGTGVVFDTWTEIGSQSWGFRERIAPGAADKTIKEADIRSMFNHDPNYLLGRTTAGTLKLTADDEAVRYDILINEDDPQAVGVHAKVARGDVTGSSFWFRVLKDEWTDSDATESGWDERSILEFEMIETGPVTFPAYDTTEAEAKSLRAANELVAALDIPRTKRARVAFDLVTSSEERADALAEAITKFPGLVERLGSRAAGDAPAPTAETPPATHVSPAKYIAIAKRRASTYGDPMEGMVL